MRGRQPDDDDWRVPEANNPDSNAELFQVAVDRDEQPSEAVVRTVSTVSGKEPTSLAPLYDFLDPDALDALLENSDRVTVRFEFDGYPVTVQADGRALVRAAAPMTN